MAATAEMLTARPQPTDYDRQFSDITSHLDDVFCDVTRAPESEIYGRSLSTIHRMGALMIGKPVVEVVSSPEAAQARVEFYTSVEEGFGTDVQLGGGLEVRDFDKRPVINGRVMSKDLKTSVSDMTEAGLICAEATAETDHRFLPQLTRSKWDHENACIVDKMARGETSYNTRIVVSPFPEEAAAQSGSEYWRDIGYVPHLKRGFVQLYHVGSGEVITGSLSFDGSDKQKLRQVFSEYGIEIPEGELTDNWLQYAVTDTLSQDQAKAFATTIADRAGSERYKKNTNTVSVTHEYRSLMDQVFDESYIHICESQFRGYQTEAARGLILQLTDKAQHFNQRYQAALYKMRSDKNQFSDDDTAILHELLVYSTIEMMRALHIGRTELPHEYTEANYQLAPNLAHLLAIDASAFQGMLSGFGAEGAKNNRAYSACGLSIAPGEGNNSPGDPQGVFGGNMQGIEGEGAATGKKDKFGPLKFKCPKGHWNKRPPADTPKDFLTHCKTCKASLKC